MPLLTNPILKAILKTRFIVFESIYSFLIVGSRDFKSSLNKHKEVWFLLGWVDIQQRYRRSKLGPFWITIAMAVTVSGMGFIFATLFGIPLRSFLPYLALGMILWTFVTTALIDGCNAFIQSEGMIKQVALPFFAHILRVTWRNFIILLHNLAIFPILLLIFFHMPSPAVILCIPGMLLIVINILWLAMAAGIFCTRFRDLTQIVTSILQLWFFVTPIIWKPELMIEKGRSVILDLNPFYHLIEIVRAPLLGQFPSVTNWIACIVLAVIGWSLTLLLLGRYRNRISYWL